MYLYTLEMYKIINKYMFYDDMNVTTWKQKSPIKEYLFHGSSRF